jgi:hypothetical protein
VSFTVGERLGYPATMRACLGALAVLVVFAGCQTYQDDLTRAQRAFEQNQHERALAILRQLEPDTSRLSLSEQAQYAYVRGMTDYRIGYKVDARHWLALCRTMEQQTAGLLPEDWKKRAVEALNEMNENVYGGGLESLSNAKKKPSDDSEGTSKKKKSEDEP